MNQSFDEGNKPCVLYERECLECGECDICDLDETKLCDNCMKCVNQSDADFLAIDIEKIEE